MLTLNDLSLSGQIKLLDTAFSPILFGISSIPVCALALAIWAKQLQKSTTGILIWGGIYAIVAISIWLIYTAYRKDKLKMNELNLIKKWMPIIHKIAFTHGLGLTAPIFITMGKVPFEFVFVYYFVIAAVIATYAAHLSTLLNAFLLLFLSSWGISALASPWAFPHHWHFIILFMMVFAGSMYKHAISSHQFFLKQIWLEEEGARLAERYKAAKEEAETALQAKNQFLTTASHDLRQPVHAMGFLIESILRRNKDTTIEPALNDLKLSVRSVAQMFNSLLDLSKIESGMTQSQASIVFIDDLIQDIARVYAEEAHARNLQLRVRLSQGKAIAKTDGNLLRQSLMNLVHNALRYTRQGGVLIACRRRGNHWQIEVWDTGIGVAIEDQKQIFSPFFRNEHAWKIDSAGHGLGLAVVARCCDLMGSEYGLSSKLGKGSRFWLRVPAVTDRMQSVRIINVSSMAGSGTMHEKLNGACLIVDDDPHVSNAWESLLTTWGLQVKCASSATEAFAVLDAGFTPQAILCDQRLRAGESGFDLLRALLERCPAAHGAMISGEFNSPELQQAEEEGYLVLHKPLEPETLHVLLARWLM